MGIFRILAVGLLLLTGSVQSHAQQPTYRFQWGAVHHEHLVGDEKRLYDRVVYIGRKIGLWPWSKPAPRVVVIRDPMRRVRALNNMLFRDYVLRERMCAMPPGNNPIGCAQGFWHKGFIGVPYFEPSKAKRYATKTSHWRRDGYWLAMILVHELVHAKGIRGHGANYKAVEKRWKDAVRNDWDAMFKANMLTAVKFRYQNTWTTVRGW